MVHRFSKILLGGCLEVQSCVYLCYLLGPFILCAGSCIRPGNGSRHHSGNGDRLHRSCHSGCDGNGHDALTKAARETRTNSQGNYEMFGLKPGTYTVAITAPGMSKKEITDIVLNGSDTVSVDAVLKVSAAQESVVVSMEAPAINTEDQTISQTLNVVDLPRDSRNVYTFLYLNPNVTRRLFQVCRSSELRRQLLSGWAALQRRYFW